MKPKITVENPYTNEHGALMLGYNETLLENAEPLVKKTPTKK